MICIGMVATNLAQHIPVTPYVLKWAPWTIVRAQPAASPVHAMTRSSP